jgi:7,8-dihydroneopterin aldolase/epimerase/oxygenase
VTARAYPATRALTRLRDLFGVYVKERKKFPHKVSTYLCGGIELRGLYRRPRPQVKKFFLRVERTFAPPITQQRFETDVYNNPKELGRKFMNSDTIFIDGMSVLAKIGTTDQERSLPQKLSISLKLYAPLDKAGKSDRLEDSIDYSRIESETRLLAESKTYQLVESLAESIATAVLSGGAVEAVWVRIEKTVLKSVDCVGVEIWRSRK